jgi:hypothetical protein
MRIHNLGTAVLTMIIALAASAAAAGQAPARAPAAALGPRSVEIGVNVSGFGGYVPTVMSGPQITFNLTPRSALQLGLDMRRERRTESWRVDGFYTALYRFTFVDTADVRGFIVAGAAGAIEGRHYDAFSSISPARTSAASTRWHTSLPVIGVVGAGMDVRIASRVAFQGQFDIGISPYGLGARAAMGLSVGIGPRAR